MPEAGPNFIAEGKKTAFIWYHADSRLANALRAWVEQTGQSLGIPAKILVRRQAERTTFMEIYEAAGNQNMEDMVEIIEACAAAQSWFARLQSPRRAEIFSEFPAQAESPAS